MADRHSMDRRSGDPASSAAQDARIERAVLALLLDEHPDRLTLEELRRVLHPEDPEGAKPSDAMERAVRELVGAGLLHRHGQFVMPTRAALYFERLEAN
jgi:hypothetical protein